MPEVEIDLTRVISDSQLLCSMFHRDSSSSCTKATIPPRPATPPPGQPSLHAPAPACMEVAVHEVGEDSCKVIAVPPRRRIPA